MLFSVSDVKCMEGDISRQASGMGSGSRFWWRGLSKNARVGICKGMDSKEGVCCVLHCSDVLPWGCIR